MINKIKRFKEKGDHAGDLHLLAAILESNKALVKMQTSVSSCFHLQMTEKLSRFVISLGRIITLHNADYIIQIYSVLFCAFT